MQRKSKVQVAIENRHQKPIKALLQEFYSKGLDQRSIARELSVSQGTISLWTNRSGITIQTKREIVVSIS